MKNPVKSDDDSASFKIDGELVILAHMPALILSKEFESIMIINLSLKTAGRIKSDYR